MNMDSDAIEKGKIKQLRALEENTSILGEKRESIIRS